MSPAQAVGRQSRGNGKLLAQSRAWGGFTGGDATSQALSLNEMLLGLEAKIPLWKCVVLATPCHAESPEEMGIQFLWDAAHP